MTEPLPSSLWKEQGWAFHSWLGMTISILPSVPNVQTQIAPLGKTFEHLSIIRKEAAVHDRSQ